jgi:hypothetical protein
MYVHINFDKNGLDFVLGLYSHSCVFPVDGNDINDLSFLTYKWYYDGTSNDPTSNDPMSNDPTSKFTT